MNKHYNNKSKTFIANLFIFKLRGQQTSYTFLNYIHTHQTHSSTNFLTVHDFKKLCD